MEIVSPLTFLYSLSSPLTLSPARQLLATLFVLHYLNRSIISTLRNPGRAKMHISVFFSAVGFNLINGFLLGTYLSGAGDTSLHSDSWGIETPILFFIGLSLFLLGLAGNIYSDEVLYNLRRNRSTKVLPSAPISERYGIPRGFLYDWPCGGIAFPNYFTEWIEWSGFLLCIYSLPRGFPQVVSPEMEMVIKGLPEGLRPMMAEWAQPMALFLMNEVSAMLPRAISGAKWYRANFKDYPEGRKIVIPGIF